MRIPIHHVQREAARWTIYAFKPAKRGGRNRLALLLWSTYRPPAEIVRTECWRGMASKQLCGASACEAETAGGDPVHCGRLHMGVAVPLDCLFGAFIRQDQQLVRAPQGTGLRAGATTNLESQDCLKTNRSVQWAYLDFGIRGISRVPPS